MDTITQQLHKHLQRRFPARSESDLVSLTDGVLALAHYILEDAYTSGHTRPALTDSELRDTINEE